MTPHCCRRGQIKGGNSEKGVLWGKVGAGQSPQHSIKLILTSKNRIGDGSLLLQNINPFRNNFWIAHFFVLDSLGAGFIHDEA